MVKVSSAIEAEEMIPEVAENLFCIPCANSGDLSAVFNLLI